MDIPTRNVDLGPTEGGQPLSTCTTCLTLDCDSIHGPVVQECRMLGCYICRDFSRINDEIASTYKRLVDLVEERQKIKIKPNHDTFIHRMPVEVLSLIFVFVKEAVLDVQFECYLGEVCVPKRTSKQPSISPPLLVGAVCKGWRNVSLATPQLWTDITTDLTKSAKGQSSMVKEWAHRSGALPLDVAVVGGATRRKSVISALRSLAHRWNDLTLDNVSDLVPYDLLDSLEDTPTINTLYLFGVDGIHERIRLQPPLRPQRLVSDFLDESMIPLEWDRLLFLKITSPRHDELLHIIQHAPNLRHYIGGVFHEVVPGAFPIPSDPITHHSLIYLDLDVDISGEILDHLTLPSLLHLDYTSTHYPDIESMVQFLKRSRPTLRHFGYHSPVPLRDLMPTFERLSGVTSLSIAIEDDPDDQTQLDRARLDDFLTALSHRPPPNALSHLKHITFHLSDLTDLSWSVLNSLFSDGADSPVILDTTSYTPIRQSLETETQLPLTDEIRAAMKTKAFSRLLEVKKSGVNIRIVGCEEDEALIL